MLVFNDRHFLRHISSASLREFTEQHVVGSWINMDWTDMSDSLYSRICDRVQELEQKLKTEVMDANVRKSIATDLYL